MYLLDTNTIIYFFKDLGSVSDVLLSKPPGKIAIPSIALYELEVGIAKSKNPRKRRKQLKEFVSQVTVFQFGAREAAAAAQVRVTLERLGTPIGPYDTFIAGIALSTKSILVTHNIKEFERIEKLDIEDWF